MTKKKKRGKLRIEKMAQICTNRCRIPIRAREQRSGAIIAEVIEEGKMSL